jgi:uncharacterized membrane protein
MGPITFATFFGISGTVAGMCAAGVAASVIGVWTAKSAIARARGLEKIVAATSLCVAIPLAVFGAEHLFGPQLMRPLVPSYMPWRMFWVYFIGCSLIAASLSIATGIAVRWSGMLFGVMMFLFVAMIHLVGALAQPHNRIIWTIVFREMSFGAAGWILGGAAMARGRRRSTLMAVACIFVALTAIVFGVEHFLHPESLPGVPLEKQMAAWIPGRVLIDYVTGAALLVFAGSILLNRGMRTVGACVGGWILLMILVIYVPVMILALADPRAGVQLEGVNYFADTLLFAGVVLAAATAAE